MSESILANPTRDTTSSSQTWRDWIFGLLALAIIAVTAVAITALIETKQVIEKQNTLLDRQTSITHQNSLITLEALSKIEGRQTPQTPENAE